MTHAIIFLLVALVLSLEYLSWRLYRRLQGQQQLNHQLTDRFAGVIDLEQEKHTIEKQLSEARIAFDKLEVETTERKNALEREYSEALANRDKLKSEIALLEENLEDISCGLYQPHFSFQTSEDYKLRLLRVREQERQMIRSHIAVSCPQQWTVNGDVKQGTRMIKQYTKLLLRAFNGECDAAIAEATWSNIIKMEGRIKKAHADINELGSVMQVSVTTEYLTLKLDELRLAEEYEEKRYREREEQRRIREQIREEERAQKNWSARKKRLGATKKNMKKR